MEPDKKKKAAAALQHVGHYLVGLAIVLKGIEKAEHFHDHPVKVVVLFLTGTVVLALVAGHHALQRRFPRANVTALVHLSECLALFTAGLILLERGGSRIPYFLLFLAVVYAIIGTTTLLAGSEQREVVGRRLVLILGPLFLGASAVSFALNWRGSGNAWVYVIATLFAVTGVGLLALHRLLPRRLDAHASADTSTPS